MTLASLGKMPTIRARRFTSLLSRSSGLVLSEHLTAGVGNEVAEDTEADAQHDVRGVGERGRDPSDEYVACDASSDASEDGHEQDPDHG
jgi:hypothetical protein